MSSRLIGRALDHVPSRAAGALSRHRRIALCRLESLLRGPHRPEGTGQGSTFGRAKENQTGEPVRSATAAAPSTRRA